MNEILWPLVALYIIVPGTMLLLVLVIGKRLERSGDLERRLPAADLRQSGSATKDGASEDRSSG